MNNEETIPVSISKLIIAYFNQTISKGELDSLDEWILASDDNMKIFDEMVSLVEDRRKAPKWNYIDHYKLRGKLDL